MSLCSLPWYTWIAIGVVACIPITIFLSALAEWSDSDKRRYQMDNEEREHVYYAEKNKRNNEDMDKIVNVFRSMFTWIRNLFRR